MIAIFSEIFSSLGAAGFAKPCRLDPYSLKGNGMAKYTQQQLEEIVYIYSGKTDEELCEIVRTYARKLGRTPKKDEVPGSRYIKSRLGPWPRVLEKAGVKEVSKVYERRAEARKEKRKKQRERRKGSNISIE